MKKERAKACDCLKEFDFYKNLPRELAEPTYVGATMSVGVLGLMAFLIFIQTVEFFSFQKTSEMIIDTSEEDQFVSFCRLISPYSSPLIWILHSKKHPVLFWALTSST